MRVKISANPPLPPVRAWFPLTLPSAQSTPTITSFKSHLCRSLPAFRGVPPSSLRFSIDGFQLLDNSELTIVKDGDLICVDVLDVPSQDASAHGATHATQPPAASGKRKRRLSSPSSSSSESGATTESTSSASASESESDTSDSESASDTDESSRSTTPSLRKKNIHISVERAQVMPFAQPKPRVVHPGKLCRVSLDGSFTSTTFVPPGHGKPQTRARNLRRRLRRMHEGEVPGVSQGGPVTGTNTVVVGKDTEAQGITSDVSGGLMSLSLRNKNKAKNFKSLIGRPLAPKIIFGEQEGDGSGAMGTSERGTRTRATRALPRLIPPSSRARLPPNVIVTSVDVEAGMYRAQKKRKLRIEYDAAADVSLDYGDPEVEKLEAMADKDWGTLEKLKSEEQVRRGMVVGYKGLAIDPVTCTPEQCLVIGRVVSRDSKGVIVRLLRARDQVEKEEEWGEILNGDWRVFN